MILNNVSGFKDFSFIHYKFDKINASLVECFNMIYITRLTDLLTEELSIKIKLFQRFKKLLVESIYMCILVFI